MLFTSLRLQNMRLYHDETFEFDEGVNIVVGPNASGKTTLLEALTVSMSGSSYKAKDAELIRHDAPWMRIDAQLSGSSRTTKLQPRGGSFIKTYEFDGVKLIKLVSQRKLPFVLFEPDQMLLLSSQPDLRRTLLDDLIEQADPAYETVRRQYRRILAQRNSLLKKPGSRADDFFVWNLRLSEYGGVIAARRQEMLDALNSRLSELYSSVAAAEHVIGLSYAAVCKPTNYETDMLRQLEQRLEIDRQRGYTTRGPHRDDIEIRINDHLLQTDASRGETRTLLLAFKIAEAVIVEEARGQRPIFLLDDVFGELDGKRRRYLTDLLRTYQTFITTTDADIAIDHFGATTNLIAL